MEQMIRDIMARMYATVKAGVPECGDFAPVSEGFSISDPNLVADRYWLQAEAAPKGLEGHDHIRGLFFYARKGEPSVNVLLVVGNRQQLLDSLQFEELFEKLMFQTGNLSYNLIDLH